MLERSGSEGGERPVGPRRLDADRATRVERHEARALAGVVLGLVHLGGGGVGEHCGALPALDDHRHAGEVGRSDGLDGEVGEPLEGLLDGAITDEELRQRSDAVAERGLWHCDDFPRSEASQGSCAIKGGAGSVDHTLGPAPCDRRERRPESAEAVPAQPPNTRTSTAPTLPPVEVSTSKRKVRPVVGTAAKAWSAGVPAGNGP